MKKFYAFAAAALLATAANAQNLYITGAGGFTNGEWNAETPDEFAQVNGQYEIEVANLSAFKISTAAGSWEEFNTGVLGCNYGETTGVAVALEPGFDANINCPWPGDYKVVVSGDMSTITLTTDTPAPTGPITLYLRGDMNGWGADPAWALSSEDGNIYKFVFGEEQQIGVGESFKIAGDPWSVKNIGFGDDTEPILLDTDKVVVAGDNPGNMSLEEACNGVCWLILDYEGESYVAFSNDKSFVPDWADDNNAVAAVEVANEAPVYYNLQGVRVANPANGIYVKVVAGKATKAVVK